MYFHTAHVTGRYLNSFKSGQLKLVPRSTMWQATVVMETVAMAAEIVHLCSGVFK